MSRENVECVRRLLRAFNDGDVEALVPIFRGHDGVRRWADLVMGQELGSLEGQIERIEEADDAVLASVVIEGEGSSSGARVQMHVCLVLTFRAGKLARREVFETLAEALEAVGLRE